MSSRAIAILVLAVMLGCGPGLSAFAQPPPAFSAVIVFGDSLSDTGNVRQRTGERSGGLVDYPSQTFNYSNGRFTNDNHTDPPSFAFAGVWHEQLALSFLGLFPASFSLGGGLNFAFGGARSTDGTHEQVVVTTPFGDISITIDDMGKQMDDYLNSHAINPTALYIVWGSGNDLRTDESVANVTATAARTTALANRLAVAGAQYIMVPNVPPIGNTPGYVGQPERIDALNAASATFRQVLNEDLDTLVSELAAQGITPAIYRPDVWTGTLRIFCDAPRYGFINTNGAAQDHSVNPDQFLFWDDIHPTAAAHYQLAKGAFDAITIPAPASSKALNIATRVSVDVGERISIAGFIVDGDTTKRVIIRGVGPSLAAVGVPGPLADPTLTLYDGNGIVLRSNDNWQDSQAAEINSTGLAPPNFLESAIVATLQPGHYTAALVGKDNTTGNGLVEVYDLESNNNAVLANLSTRGFVGTGDNVMIGSLIIGNGDSPIVVLRAIGPSLANAGVADPLLDPTIELHDGNGAVIGFNDNWADSQMQAVSATQLAPSDDHEAAIITPFLTPGNYTAVVRGKDGTTGVALVEAYRVP